MPEPLDLTDLYPWDDDHLARHQAALALSSCREPVERLRYQYDSLFDALPVAAGTETWTRAVGTHRVLLVTNERQMIPAPYLWFHSCGVVLGGPRSALSFASHLAAASRRPVLLPMLQDPAHRRFGDVLDVVAELAHALRRMFGDGLWRRALVGGDCTGAVLALTAAATVAPAAVALVSPVIDLGRRTGDHALALSEDPSAIGAFLPDAKEVQVRIGATIETVARQGPPCTILASAREPAVDDADSLARRLSGVVQLSVRQASPCHVAPLFAAARPDGRVAVEIISKV